MTNRERILASLEGKETDRVCWSPLIDGYYIQSLPQMGYPMDILEAMRYIGNDIMERHVGVPETFDREVELRVERSSDNKKIRTVYQTKVGAVFDERSMSGSTQFVSKHPIETVEDLKVYQYIYEHRSYKTGVDVFIQRDREIGDDGIATTDLPITPIQCMLQHLAGVENTVYLLEDYPQETEGFLEVIHEKNKESCHLAAEYPTPAVFIYEDTSSTVLSRKWYKKYCMSQLDDYAQILHGRGIKLITHMCGKLSLFADEIRSGKQDGVDSVCPPTTGDLYAWDARECLGRDKILIGGIEPPSLVRMNSREVVKNVEDIMQKLTDTRGFILSTGDAVPFGTPFENLKAITDYVKKKGKL